MKKNKLKLSLLLTLSFVVIGIQFVFAADLNYTADTNVSIGGNNYVITSGSAATSLIIGDNNITLTVASGDTFTLKSANHYLFTTNPALAEACTIDDNRVVVIGPVTSQIITPNTGSTCSRPAGTTVSYSYVISTSVATAPTTSATSTTATSTIPVAEVATSTASAISDVSATPATSAVLKVLPYAQPKTIVEMQANLNVLLENLAILQAVQKTISAPAVSASLTEIGASIPLAGSYKIGLALGSKGNNVSALQNFLKMQGSDIYPEGIVSGYFGQLTKKAVQRFQEKHGIAVSGDVGYGYVGPKTRAKINQLLGL